MYTLQEHQSKKLITGDNLIESAGIIGKINPETVLALNESAKGKSNRKLIVQMEAIHVGRTDNYTFYTEEGLKSGLSTWTHPYNKPVLTHHNAHRGEPVGRILRAEFAESTISGRKGLIFTCEITDPDAVEKVLDGRYTTVSIGATTDKVSCNICGKDRTKEWCEHWRGEEYEGQACHYIIGTTFGREVSYVNVPADENAGNFSVTVSDEDGNKNEHTQEHASLQIFQIAEGLMQSVNRPDVNLYESASDDVKQLVNGLLTIDEGGTPNVKYKLNESGQIVDENGVVVNVAEAAKMQADLTQAQNELTAVKGQLSEAQATLSNMVIEKTKVESQLTESQGEVTRLTNENADLVAKSHKSLAEKVVDMKLALRKSDVVGVSHEEAVEAHIKRTEESLNDAVKDLQAEMQNTTAIRGTVPNPGGAGANNNPNEHDDNNKMGVDEAVDMFSGMFGRKRKK
ncbi:hypothetical protein P4I89_08675 [Bacillus cereus]|uniref:hypothetical protein n=1 Tax=Bacillus thuringiensis TaxID=1428 RepID=UPI0024BC014B|nr:hypothetical protein [Bacillus thuringiensis]MEB9509567.1 hypothetical protein [Bacillus cereus]